MLNEGEDQLDDNQSRQSINQSKQYQEEHSTFMPMIHSKSKRIVRGEKIENILYKDALRR